MIMSTVYKRKNVFYFVLQIDNNIGFHGSRTHPLPFSSQIYNNFYNLFSVQTFPAFVVVKGLEIIRSTISQQFSNCCSISSFFFLGCTSFCVHNTTARLPPYPWQHNFKQSNYTLLDRDQKQRKKEFVKSISQSTIILKRVMK